MLGRSDPAVEHPSGSQILDPDQLRLLTVQVKGCHKTVSRRSWGISRVVNAIHRHG